MRLLIQSATKTSNYNLKHVNILAEDTQAPKVQSVTPADGAADVIPTGKAVILFSEGVKAKANTVAVLRNNANGMTTGLSPVIKGNKASFPYSDLDLTTSYTLTVAAGSFSDLADNVLNSEIKVSFTTSDTRPVPPPVLDSKNRLWYHRPASYWEEALPLGNGRLGVMVSGGVAKYAPTQRGHFLGTIAQS